MRLTVKVIPRSSCDRVVGTMADGTLKVKLVAPPVDGKANISLLRLLSKHFSCPISRLTLISGETANKKIIDYT